MSSKNKFKALAAGVCLAAWSGVGYAGDASLNLTLPAEKTIVLAANDQGAGINMPLTKATTSAPVAEYDAPAWSGSNVHKYLGLATMGATVLTMATASEGCEHNCPAVQTRDTTGTHAKAAMLASGLAAATVVTGLISHWEDFSTADGWKDPDNLHALLGTAGAALMGYASYKSAQQTTGQVSHAGLAEAGALGMLVAIGLTW